jgi:hypothetical protein
MSAEALSHMPPRVFSHLSRTDAGALLDHFMSDSWPSARRGHYSLRTVVLVTSEAVDEIKIVHKVRTEVDAAAEAAATSARALARRLQALLDRANDPSTADALAAASTNIVSALAAGSSNAESITALRRRRRALLRDSIVEVERLRATTSDLVRDYRCNSGSARLLALATQVFERDREAVAFAKHVVEAARLEFDFPPPLDEEHLSTAVADATMEHRRLVTRRMREARKSMHIHRRPPRSLSVDTDLKYLTYAAENEYSLARATMESIDAATLHVSEAIDLHVAAIDECLHAVWEKVRAHRIAVTKAGVCWIAKLTSTA